MWCSKKQKLQKLSSCVSSKTGRATARWVAPMELLEGRQMFSAAPAAPPTMTPVTLHGVVNEVGLSPTGQLEANSGSGWSVIDTGITSWTTTSLLGTNYLFDLSSSGVLKENASPSTSGWMAEDGYVTKMGVSTMGGLNYVFDLNTSGVLKDSMGKGWVTQDTGVTDFGLTNMIGSNYIFDLNTSGVLKDSKGSGWVTQDTGVTKFGLSTMIGQNYIFDLNSSDVLKDSYGQGWTTQDTGVTDFGLSNMCGQNYIFDLNTSGVLKDSYGWGWTTQDTGVTSFGLTNLNGTNYIFDLNTQGDLKQSSGWGWSVADSSVTSYQLTSFNAQNCIFDLNTDGVLKQSLSQGWSVEDTGISKFGICNEAGTNYLFDLSRSGTLEKTLGHGWASIDSSVNNFYITNEAGGSYVTVKNNFADELSLTLTSDTAAHLDVMQYGASLNITADGTSFTEPTPSGDLLIHTRGGADSVGIWTSVRTIAETIDNANTTVFCAGSNISVWADSTDTVTAAQNTHYVASFAGGVSKSVGDSLANPTFPEESSVLTTANMPLWGNGPAASDINQGRTGDCYFLAGLAGYAQTDPNQLLQSVVDMGDGTYVVEFHSGTQNEFVRVNDQFPSNGTAGTYAFAHPGANQTDWGLVMEKAFCYFRSGASNSYYTGVDASGNPIGGISGGFPSEVYTDLGATPTDFTPANVTDATLYSELSADLKNAFPVTFNTLAKNAPDLVSMHTYTLLSVSKTNGVDTYTVRNPWGHSGVSLENSSGIANLTYAQLVANFNVGFA